MSQGLPTGVAACCSPHERAGEGVLTSFAVPLDTVGGTLWSGDDPFHIEETLRGRLGPEVVGRLTPTRSVSEGQSSAAASRCGGERNEKARLGTRSQVRANACKHEAEASKA